MSIQIIIKTLLLSPCVLGMILVASTSPSLAETAPQSQSIEGKITPFQIAQTDETIIESDPQTDETNVSQSNRWHFLIGPYLYLPVTIYGDTNVRRFSKDFNSDFDDVRTTVRENLDFAFFGDLQAWTPNYHIGIIANIDYVSLSGNDSFNRSLRYPRLDKYIPTEFDVKVDNQLLSGSLGAAYRFYNEAKVNPEGVSSEFDLGLLVFNVFTGVDVTSVNTDVDLSTNLGGEASLSDSKTVVSPMLGAQLRLNFTPKLALVTTGSVAGFGISGLTKWSAMSGIDWMFSGNTSLGIGYRVGYTDYNLDLDNGENFGLSINQNGPYMSLSFRF